MATTPPDAEERTPWYKYKRREPKSTPDPIVTAPAADDDHVPWYKYKRRTPKP
jgi:hypothetical protein